MDPPKGSDVFSGPGAAEDNTADDVPVPTQKNEKAANSDLKKEAKSDLKKEANSNLITEVKSDLKKEAKSDMKKKTQCDLKKEAQSDLVKEATPGLKRKKPKHPPTSQMVLESIKCLKMRKGASARDIREYMEGHYNVNMKYMTPHVNRSLKTGVESGILQEVGGAGATERFKIRKMEAVKKVVKDKQHLKHYKRKMKIKAK